MNKNKLKSEKAITLIALVVTIVVLIILAGVAINVTLGENGIINRSQYAKEQNIIEQYREKIELVKFETILKYNNNIVLENLKNEFESYTQKLWINAVTVIVDNGIEKIKLTTKDGYIFYVTGNTTEYKEKGKVIEKITAKELSYTPENANWKVDNVKEALDYLLNN